eukprot:TRINITY_DN2247_c0_g1_i2.p1 TRINITY_DN2247_c0_g1~~TRINITY_DN2247_c0_g1_i2.p1  ORF type:complete len:328 (-),score=60.07 TRINITY_DN2247_c0_g1_i2:123-1106(-)
MNNLVLRFEDFVTVRVIGTGTFGIVYLVNHKPTTRYFALKCMSKQGLVTMHQVEHTQQERAILLALDNPFIVKLYETYQDATHLYMLMEYVIGGEIFTHLRRAGRFSPEVAKFFLAEIVLALEYMHNRGIIYRDLKPENIMLDVDGHVKLTDFGFSKRVPDRTWTLCGTPEYLAPEVIQGAGHNRAVDWWSLGILTYEMLSGATPFYDANDFMIYEKIVAGHFTFPDYFDPCSRDLISRLLTTDKTRRLGSLRGGANDIKTHPFFRGTDWDGVLQKSGPSPIVPVVKSPGDCSNFEDYDECCLPAGIAGAAENDDREDIYRNFFKDF